MSNVIRVRVSFTDIEFKKYLRLKELIGNNNNSKTIKKIILTYKL